METHSDWDILPATLHGEAAEGLAFDGTTNLEGTLSKQGISPTPHPLGICDTAMLPGDGGQMSVTCVCFLGRSADLWQGLWKSDAVLDPDPASSIRPIRPVGPHGC